MGLTNGGHVTLSGNGKLRIVTTMLGILGGNICAVVCTYKRGARVRHRLGLEIVGSAEE